MWLRVKEIGTWEELGGILEGFYNLNHRVFYKISPLPVVPQNPHGITQIDSYLMLGARKRRLYSAISIRSITSGALSWSMPVF